jgi:hypothetical protein
MILCDLCGKTKRCQPRQIEEREYDICRDCWNLLAAKLKGKGRIKEEREMVYLPPPSPAMPGPKETEPLPGEPPKIWSSARWPH